MLSLPSINLMQPFLQFVSQTIHAEQYADLRTELYSEPDFIKYNEHQHNRFSAAINKLLESIGAKIPEKAIVPHGDNCNRQSIASADVNSKIIAVLKQHYEYGFKYDSIRELMLSLPEDWDYTLAGLSHINRESIDAIRTAVWELEKAGYITRQQGRDAKGKMAAIEYTIYEQPQPPSLENPMLENPTTDNPILENPTTDNPTTENPMQLNKDIQRTDLPKKDKSNTDLSITHSIPILSPNPSPFEDDAAKPQESKRKETETQSAFEIYEEIIKENISYDLLKQDMPYDCDRLDEIVDLILETVCTRRKTIRIAGDDYPAELVKAKFMKLDSEHIRFVLDCMQKNTTKIRNIKQYLRAVLFNAPSTIDNYYTSLVAHDTLNLICTVRFLPLMPRSFLPAKRVWDTSQQAIFSRRAAGRRGAKIRKGYPFPMLATHLFVFSHDESADLPKTSAEKEKRHRNNAFP